MILKSITFRCSHCGNEYELEAKNSGMNIGQIICINDLMQMHEVKKNYEEPKKGKK